jgi:hypothetical protein
MSVTLFYFILFYKYLNHIIVVFNYSNHVAEPTIDDLMCMIGIALSILFTEEKIKLLRLYLIYHFVLIKKIITFCLVFQKIR